MKRIDVTAERPYTVCLGHGALAELPALVGEAERIAILAPASLRDWLPRLTDALNARVHARVRIVEVPDAERAKTPEVLANCWAALAEAGLTRSDLVIGFGGGATTDLAGFVAATYLRGVDLITVPSTVLGMVDAAVGGKTGINIAAGKNLVGAFYEPRAVLCDLDLLASLPPADLRAGLAEVAKCGFIADPQILAIIEAAPEAVVDAASPELAEIIARGIAVKAETVSQDLRERTSSGERVGRELLNYGHTLAHAIERAENYRMRHGDAVAIGMCFAAELARVSGRLDDAVADRHHSILETLQLPTGYAAEAWPELYAAMFLDKKTRGSTLRFVVLDALARASILTGPQEQTLRSAYAAISS